MKKIIFLLLCTVTIYGQTYQNPTYGTVTEKTNTTDNTPAYFVTSQTDGVHKKTPAALIAKTATVNDSLATKENVANKSDSYTVSSSTTYASTKALVDGLDLKAVDANVLHKTGEETIGLGEKYFTDNVNFADIAVSGQATGMAAVFPNEFVIKSQLDLKAPLSSPTFTGTPTAPTAAPGTNTTQIATTAFVNAGLATKQNTITNPTTGVGSQNDQNTYALQDGTILYHSTKWFVPTGTVSTSGTTVTSVGTQFASNMVGAKLIINGEWRIITGYTSSTVVTVASAYSQDYSGVVAGSWGVYSRSYISRLSTVLDYQSQRFFDRLGKVVIGIDDNIVRFEDLGQQSLNSLQMYADGIFLGGSRVLQWSSNTSGLNEIGGTKDLGLRRNTAGVLEIYDGVTADGAIGNRRDLLARNITATNYNGSATLTGTPTAPTATAGTNTTQIATTAFVQGVDANVVHKTGNETISGYKSFDASTSFPDIRFSFSSELASLNQNLNNFPIFRNVNGHLGINSKSSWGASISTALLTVSRNYTLPDVDGSIFIQGSVLKLKAYTVGTLPAGTVGDMAYVTDATAPTYNGTLTGGGAVKIPVFYDGTAWKAH